MRTAPSDVLPDDVKPQMTLGARLAVLMIAYLVTDIVVLYLLMSGSASVFALIVEDGLELVPPIAFLVTARTRSRSPSARYPYGYHRSVTLGSFASAVALLVFGLMLVLFSARSLLQGTHPTIGSIELSGELVWRGWLVLLWLVPGTFLPFLIGRKMLRPARATNNKVLFETSRMLVADWQTSLAAAIGIIGIAFGVWWLDSAAAIFIALSIVLDGVRNTRRTGGALMDRMPTKIGSDEIIDLVGSIEEVAEATDWVRDVEVRLREEGAVYSGDVLVAAPREVDTEQLDGLGTRIRELDWRLREVLVVPVNLDAEEELDRAPGGDGQRGGRSRGPAPAAPPSA